MHIYTCNSHSSHPSFQPSFTQTHPSPLPHTPYYAASGLERIVLGRNLMLMQVSNDRDFLNDIFSDAGDIGEEEEGEDTSCGAEIGSCAGAVGFLD